MKTLNVRNIFKIHHYLHYPSEGEIVFTLHITLCGEFPLPKGGVNTVEIPPLRRVVRILSNVMLFACFSPYYCDEVLL